MFDGTFSDHLSLLITAAKFEIYYECVSENNLQNSTISHENQAIIRIPCSGKYSCVCTDDIAASQALPTVCKKTSIRASLLMSVEPLSSLSLPVHVEVPIIGGYKLQAINY